MSLHTKMSEKGQVVIPKDVRDRLKLLPGDSIEVVERPDGVLLRKPITKTSETFDEITARLRALVRYDGPPVSTGEMKQSIADMWASGGPRWDG